MKFRVLTSIIAALLLAVAASANATEPADTTVAGSVVHAEGSGVQEGDTVVKRNFIQKVIHYFAVSNRAPSGRKFDMSIIGGPHYSSDTKFGLGLVAAGFYRSNPADTLSQPSNVSLYGDIATTGFYMLGVRGDHIFTNDRFRIDYNLYFYSFPRYFWGIGYDRGMDMANKSKFKELYVDASVDMLWRALPHFYIGPAVEFGYVNARQQERPELWNGQARHIATYGAGFRLQYDTRDNFTAPNRGWLLQLEQRICPKFLQNRYAFSYTDFRACFYRNLWNGSVMALRYHGRLAYGNVPWNMMSMFGGSSVMRGYYDGRFRDKGEMDLTLELRQHVWHRNGLVLWVGAGTVFPKISNIQFRKILPNAGIGYRWEFKKLTNVRLDFGIGKGEKSFIFSINEAF